MEITDTVRKVIDKIKQKVIWIALSDISDMEAKGMEVSIIEQKEVAIKQKE